MNKLNITGSRKLAAATIASPVLFGGAIKFGLFFLLIIKLLISKRAYRPDAMFLCALTIAMLVCAMQLILDRTDLYNCLRLVAPISITVVTTMIINNNKLYDFKITLVKFFIILSILDVLYAFTTGLVYNGFPTSISARHVYKVNTFIFPDTNYAGFFLGIGFLFTANREVKAYNLIALSGIIMSMSVAVWSSTLIAFTLYKMGKIGRIFMYPMAFSLAFTIAVLEFISNNVGDVSKLLIMKKSIELMNEYPFLGAGIGSFDSHIKWSAHTMVSQIAEVGVIGMGSLIFLLIPLMFQARKDNNLNAVVFFTLTSGIFSFFPMSFVGLVALLGLSRR